MQSIGHASSGLRLALLTFGSAEGAELRDEVLQSVLLDKLSGTEALTIETINKSFSEDIGLPRTLPESFLADALERARQRGDANTSNGKWKLTTQGEDKKNALPLQGAQQLLEGRQIVRSSLEKLTGKPFSERQFNVIWSTLIDTLSGLFHESGLEIIRGIDELLSGGINDAKPLNLKRELENAMKKVVSSINMTDLRDQTYRALLDLFTEREGPAFDWFTKVSERFVTLCALGLERSSGDALRETLTAQRVVLDSDIILDYLCNAEPDHEASRDLLVNWIKVGGTILVSPIVLEEVAHNAWISDRDFRETEMLLGKLHKWELRRFIRNPFVRTFHSYKTPASKWTTFIGQYRGNAPGDYSKILTTLRQRLKAQVLPATYDERLSNDISLFLSRLSSSFQSDVEHLEDVLYKVERDGRLLASLAAARILTEATGYEEPMILLSSSGALRSAELKFVEQFGEPRLVLDKRSFSYLLATIPQVSLGADTLRRALFNFGSHGRLKSDGVRAMRLIRSTSEVDLPWAERFTLRKELSRCIRREADRRGVSKRELEQEFVNGSSPENSAKLIVEAIQELAIPTNTQKQLDDARRRIQELEIQLADKALLAAPTNTPTIPKNRKYQ